MMTTLNGATAAVASAPLAAQPVAPVSPELSGGPLFGNQPPFGGLTELVADNAALGEALHSIVDALDLSTVEKRNLTTLSCGGEGAPTPLSASCGGELSTGEPEDIPRPAATVGGGFQPPRATVASAVEDKPMEGDMSVVLQAAPVVSAPLAEPVAPICESTVDAVSAVTRVAPVDASSVFLAVAEEIAAAVTVSPELMRGEVGEIRVQLRPDVLEGAEVVVAVDGKKMDVTFVPTVTHVADTVVANQPLVQQQLAAKIVGFEISVAVAATVATNVSVGVASSASAQAAVARARRTNGRT